MTQSKPGPANTRKLRIAGWHRLVVGRARGRGVAFRCDRYRRLLYALRRQAGGVRGEIRLPGVASYEEILADPTSRPSSIRRRTACISPPPAWPPRPASTFSSDKPIANTVAEGCEIARVCEAAGVGAGARLSAPAESHFRWIKAEIDAGRFGKLVQAECNISRDRSARSICRRGAIRPPACRAASCSRSAFIMSTCLKC